MSEWDTSEICRGVYSSARTFFEQYSSRRGHGYDGFSILQGRPIFRPPVMFIGLQPGRITKGKEQEALELEKRWPLENVNAAGDYALTKKLQEMLGPAFLKDCLGINAIFARASDSKAYKRDFDRNERAKIRKFCLTQVRNIIHATDPSRIVFIGLTTQTMFVKNWPIDLYDGKGKALTRVGVLDGRPAIAIRHLTGSYSKPDPEGEKLIKKRLRGILGLQP